MIRHVAGHFAVDNGKGLGYDYNGGSSTIWMNILFCCGNALFR